MAQSIVLTSGTILNGNPITLAVKPSIATVPDASASGSIVPSFHRIILEVECGMTGGNYEVIKMSAPVPEESSSEPIIIDISSALRTFRDSYTYTPDPTTYPIVKFNVKAYDEYMVNGEIYQKGVLFFPSEQERYCTIFGAFSDIERITSGPTKGVTTLSRKPTTSPQLVVVGDTFAYAPPYSAQQKLEQSKDLVAPQSKVVTISKNGSQTLGYQSVYAIPASEASYRQTFRFINSFGVLESISVPRTHQKKLTIATNQQLVARQETFNSLSHGIIRKHSNNEAWNFITDPLDEAWLHWYLHEFLMSEHVWMQLSSHDSKGQESSEWIRVLIIPNDDITFLDRTNGEVYHVAFTAQLDIIGSPYTI